MHKFKLSKKSIIDKIYDKVLIFYGIWLLMSHRSTTIALSTSKAKL